MHELTIPTAVARDPEALEVVRAWVTQGSLHASLQAGAFDEPGTWGVLFADLARHVAQAIADDAGGAAAPVLAAVRKVFLEELDAPAAAPRFDPDELDRLNADEPGSGPPA